MTPDDPLEAGMLLARCLEARAVPYALGGALAYGVHAVPRGTLDVDVNVFVDEAGLGSVFAALSDAGVDVDDLRARSEAAAEGMFTGRLGAYRVDVFIPSIPFSWEAARTKVPIDLDGETFFFLSAEALAVFKLLFFRGKDLVDLERLVAVQRDRIDVSYVRRQITEMMGEGDPRVAAWDRIVDQFMG